MALEDRRLLSAVSWTNANGGDWDTASNWSTGSLPGPADDVSITIAVSNPITHSSSTDSVHSLTCTDPLTISGGSLSLAAASTITGTTLTLSGGTLTGAGNLTISGTGAVLNWGNATLGGTGTTTVAARATLNITGTSEEVLDARTLTSSGTVNWTGAGTLLLEDAATFNNKGTFSDQNVGAHAPNLLYSQDVVIVDEPHPSDP
jgi:hypothetical protein